MALSALGTELVASELYGPDGERVGRVFVYVWDAGTSEWVLRGAPLAGPAVEPTFGVGVAMSGDGDVVAAVSRGVFPGLGEGIICVYEWVSDNSQYEKVGNPAFGDPSDGFGGSQNVALSGDGLVLAAGDGGRGVNGQFSGGVRVFRRDGAEWVPMGSMFEGAAAGDLAGSPVALSGDGHVLVVPSRGSDSNRGSLAVYVWSSGDWELRGSVLAGAFPRRRFGRYAALSSDGTVVAAGSDTGFGVRVFNLTAELGNVDDAVCRAVYNDDSAAYVASLGVCGGEGSRDVCMVCVGVEYPIGPLRACGVCLPGEYRHPTSYTCNLCPANSAECEAMLGSGPWVLPGSLTCGGLVSGCVATPQCSPGYYGDATDGGACVLCTDHSVGGVQRGGPVPSDEAESGGVHNASYVALSGSGAVLALGFSGSSGSSIGGFGVVRVFSWNGVAWVQRGIRSMVLRLMAGLAG